MKRLIVNADDFGLSENVNLGIVKAHREGIVTSTTLLAGCPAAEHTAELARDNPALGVGVHLCLTRETPVTEPAKLPTLTTNGRLYPGPFAFVTRFTLGLIRKEEVETELRAQVERALSLGIHPTHLDGHQHLFVMPGVFPIVLKLAREYGVPAVRFPVGPQSGSVGIGRAAEKHILELIAKGQQERLRASWLRHPDNFFGVPETGRLDEAALLRIINSLPEGTSELMCHPGLRDDAAASKTGWGYGWQGELDALMDARVKELIKENGIELINFRDV